jgi:hypothetical protein
MRRTCGATRVCQSGAKVVARTGMPPAMCTVRMAVKIRVQAIAPCRFVVVHRIQLNLRVSDRPDIERPRCRDPRASGTQSNFNPVELRRAISGVFELTHVFVRVPRTEGSLLFGSATYGAAPLHPSESPSGRIADELHNIYYRSANYITFGENTSKSGGRNTEARITSNTTFNTPIDCFNWSALQDSNLRLRPELITR